MANWSEKGDRALRRPVSAFQALCVAPKDAMNPQPKWTGSQRLQIATSRRFAMRLHLALQRLSVCLSSSNAAA